MRKLLLATLAFVALSSVASAQPQLRFVDSIMIRTNAADNVDRSRWLPFGFGPEFSDTVDFMLPTAIRERLIPAMPPIGFYALWDVMQSDGPSYTDRDIRAVPDSVASRAASRFSVVHTIEAQKGEGESIVLLVPRALPIGVDSINFRDMFGANGGLVYNETITSGPDSVIVPPNAAPDARIRMTVYYNAANIPSSVELPVIAARPAAMRLAPNPTSGRATLEASLAAGTRLVVSDLQGTTVVDAKVAETESRFPLALDGVAAGIYFVRAIGSDGTIVGESRLIVQ